MTTTSYGLASAGPLPSARTYRLHHVLRSEWTKLTSVRSSRLTLLAFVVLTIALGVTVSAVSGAHWSHRAPSARATFDPTNLSLSGLAIGELLIGVLGVLVMSGEYSSGSIRATLAAVPRRRLVLMAKAAVFTGVALVVGEAITVFSFLVGQALMGSAPHASLTQPGVARAVLGSGAFLALIGLIGLGLGTIIRHSAGAIAALAAIVLVAPFATVDLPGNVVRFTPEAILSSSIAAVRPEMHELAPWVGFLVVAGYAVVLLVAGGLLLAKRDA
jgi:ABC-2 type transport system permease protein